MLLSLKINIDIFYSTEYSYRTRDYFERYSASPQVMAALWQTLSPRPTQVLSFGKSKCWHFFFSYRF
jgi:hypothetical protein